MLIDRAARVCVSCVVRVVCVVYRASCMLRGARQALPGFVGTKLAKVAVAVGKADYPHHFPEFFAYLLALARVRTHARTLCWSGDEIVPPPHPTPPLQPRPSGTRSAAVGVMVLV